jgi:patatin-related protein
VVVDIIAGTSAGGINGVSLAKGLAVNRSQDRLRDLWLNEGDIGKLLRGPTWLPTRVKALMFAARSLARPHKIQPPLRGDTMCSLLYDALAAMNEDAPLIEAVESLVPPDHVLELFVPVTDFNGYRRDVALEDPRFVRGIAHRHLMTFRFDHADKRQFDARYDHALAFAARATSSFPGAFEPITFAAYNGAVRVPGALGDNANEFFPSYRLGGANAADSYFVDGGVLDNAPFGAALAAIRLRPAATEVDRRLVYVEPDPSEGGEASSRVAPTWHGTILGGYASIPRQEPVLDEVCAVAERNRAVARVKDIVDTSFETISGKVTDILNGVESMPVGQPSASELAAGRSEIALRAEAEAGFSFATYLRLRLRDAVDAYARFVMDLRQFPPGTYHADFVGMVLRAWANKRDLFEKNLQPTSAQRAFVEAHDLSYHDRRIRFLIAALNRWYKDDEAPDRALLYTTKASLWKLRLEIRQLFVAAASDTTIAEPLRHVFNDEKVLSTLHESRPTVTEFPSARWR